MGGMMFEPTKPDPSQSVRIGSWFEVAAVILLVVGTIALVVR